MRLFTSDLHLGHTNILELAHRTEFTDIDHMNNTLVDNWNRVVDYQDEVWILGDVCMGKISDSLALIPELRGRKILVAGNHDRCWFWHGDQKMGRGLKWDSWVQEYLDAGFAQVHPGHSWLTLGSGREVLLSHLPYDEEPGRPMEGHPTDDGLWLLHGHVHDRWQMRGRQVNVGTDVWGYQPVSEETLEWRMDARPA